MYKLLIKLLLLLLLLLVYYYVSFQNFFLIFLFKYFLLNISTQVEQYHLQIDKKIHVRVYITYIIVVFSLSRNSMGSRCRSFVIAKRYFYVQLTYIFVFFTHKILWNDGVVFFVVAIIYIMNNSHETLWNAVIIIYS